MPISRTTLTVADLPTSKAFFESALAPLGYRYLGKKGKYIGFGISTADLLLYEDTSGKRIGGTHIVLAAEDRRAVLSFYTAALKAHGNSHYSPKLREDGYNAAVYDLDDNCIEVSFDPDACLDNEEEQVSDDADDVKSWRQDGRAIKHNEHDARTVSKSKSTKSLKISPKASSSRAKSKSLETSDSESENEREVPAEAIKPGLVQRADSDSTTLMTALMKDANIDPTPNALAGTMLGMAAGAAMAYAMYKGEKDGAQQEQEFAQLMGTREQSSKRRDSKMTQDGQPSPPRSRGVETREDPRRRQQLAIEPAPVSAERVKELFPERRNLAFVSADDEPEYVSLSERPIPRLTRASTMPTESTSQKERKGKAPGVVSRSLEPAFSDDESAREQSHARSKHSHSSHSNLKSVQSSPRSKTSRSSRSSYRQQADSDSESRASRSRSRSQYSDRRKTSRPGNDRHTKNSVMSRSSKQYTTPIASVETSDAESDTLYPGDSVSQICGPANTHRRRSSATSSQMRPKSSRASHSHDHSRDVDYDTIPERTELPPSELSGKRSSPRSKHSGSRSGSTFSNGSKHRHSRSNGSEGKVPVILPSAIEEPSDDTADEDNKLHRAGDREHRGSGTTVRPKYSARRMRSTAEFEDRSQANSMPERYSGRSSNVPSARRATNSYTG